MIKEKIALQLLLNDTSLIAQGFSVDVARAKRYCHYCGEDIPKGEKCYIRRQSGMYQNACRWCALSSRKLITMFEKILKEEYEKKKPIN